MEVLSLMRLHVLPKNNNLIKVEQHSKASKSNQGPSIKMALFLKVRETHSFLILYLKLPISKNNNQKQFFCLIKKNNNLATDVQMDFKNYVLLEKEE